jgi:hypothetical protein
MKQGQGLGCNKGMVNSFRRGEIVAEKFFRLKYV